MASSGGGGAQRTGAALPAAALPLHRIPARPLSTRLIMLTYLSGLCRVLVFLGGVQQLLEDDGVTFRVCAGVRLDTAARWRGRCSWAGRPTLPRAWRTASGSWATPCSSRPSSRRRAPRLTSDPGVL